MLDKIWVFMIAGSIICSFFTGRTEQLTQAVSDGAGKAIEILINMAGVMCLWTGLMKLADKSGASGYIARIMSPFLRLIMPDCKPGSQQLNAVSANITANILGLGNAATPLGILAMKSLQKVNRLGDKPDNSMVMFVVINTASVQLIPVTAAALRSAAGSSEPYSILPYVWISSAFSLAVGITAALILGSPKHEEKITSADKRSELRRKSWGFIRYH